MLLLQKYLLENSLKQLQDEFSIIVKQSNKYPELYLFKYDQINSPIKHPLVQECRGLILNSQNNWSVVCYPFNKFFNLGENPDIENKFDWNNYKVYPKLDGSLISLYFYAGKWNIASSGNPDASGSCHESNLSFYDLAFKYIPKDISVLHTEYTYIFELISKQNKNVVIYEKYNYGLWLIGVRNNKTFKEIDMDDLPVSFLCDIEPCFNLADIPQKDIYKTVDNLKGHEYEGFVLVDSKFNRIKVKSKDYVAKHQLKSSWCLKAAIQIVLNNEIDEVVCYFPEYKKELTEIYDWLENNIEVLYENYVYLSYLPTKKEYAEFVNNLKTPFKNILFNAYNLKIDIDNIDYFKQKLYNMSVNKLEKVYKECYGTIS